MKQKLFGHSAFRIVTLAFMAAVPMFAQLPQFTTPMTTIQATAIQIAKLLAVVIFIIGGARAAFGGHRAEGIIEMIVGVGIMSEAQTLAIALFP